MVFSLKSTSKLTVLVLAHLVLAVVCLFRCFSGYIAVGLWRNFHLMQLNWVSQGTQHTHLQEGISEYISQFLFFSFILLILSSSNPLNLIINFPMIRQIDEKGDHTTNVRSQSMQNFYFYFEFQTVLVSLVCFGKTFCFGKNVLFLSMVG